MATINAFDPRTETWVNLPPRNVMGEVAAMNLLIDIRVLQQLIVMLSRGVQIQDDLQKMRIDVSNSPV